MSNPAAFSAGLPALASSMPKASATLTTATLLPISPASRMLLQDADEAFGDAFRRAERQEHVRPALGQSLEAVGRPRSRRSADSRTWRSTARSRD